MIIAAFAGTGKTTMAKLHPQTTIDLVCMPYKYELEPDGNFEDESCKASLDNIMRIEWPYNYVNAIKQIYKNDKHILIPTDLYVLMLLQKEKIPYLICYPERSAKEIYRRRFLERGNTEDFINIFIGRWDEFISSFEKDNYGRHIVLQSDQFLNDIPAAILKEDK